MTGTIKETETMNTTAETLCTMEELQMSTDRSYCTASLFLPPTTGGQKVVATATMPASTASPSSPSPGMGEILAGS